MSQEFLKRQIELRLQVWEQAKALLDRAAAENRDLTGEENDQYGRMMAELEERQETVNRVQADMTREAAAAEAVRGLEDVVRPVEERSDVEQTDHDLLRQLMRGEIRSAVFNPPERRDVLSTNTGAPIPTSFYNQLVEFMVVTGPMLDPAVSTILNTQSGETLQIPSLSAYSNAAKTAEAAAISESDPAFNAFVELKAYKYATLFQVSREMLEDSGIDLTGFIARNCGMALGTTINAKLTVGTGTAEPHGVVAAAGSGATGTVSGGAPSFDDLITLVYSVNSAYRRMPGVAFQANSTTTAAVRKLKDNDGQYLWQPSTQVGQPSTVLGFPWIENPDIVSYGSAAKSVIFGHLPAYYVRQVRGIEISNSTEFAYDKDLVTYRALVRVDGNLVDTAAIKYYKGSAS